MYTRVCIYVSRAAPTARHSAITVSLFYLVVMSSLFPGQYVAQQTCGDGACAIHAVFGTLIYSGMFDALLKMVKYRLKNAQKSIKNR